MVAGVIKITTTIKTLILEILTGEGSGHIKEIHPLLSTLLMNTAIWTTQGDNNQDPA